MCALHAGKRGRKVLLIDHAKNAGEKIRISGGGRCNFTNLNITPQNFLSENPNFCISALKRFTTQDFLALIKKHQIAFHEKTLGQLFCNGSSKQIINMLLDECKNYGVEIWLETIVKEVNKSGNIFAVITDKAILNSSSLVIATGGLSIPKMGATGFGYDVARKFNIKINQTKPGLVPLTLDERILAETKNLAGIALMALVSYKKIKFKEAILFTHRGLSGPAILQISSYWKVGEEIIINMAPEVNILEKLLNEKKLKPKQEVQTILAQILPKNLANYICHKSGCSGLLADLSNLKLKILAENVNGWKVIPSGTEGYAKAEVTLGGVDTNEISSKTFECKLVPGLYFIGEVLDVTGHLGGYNFAWAWSSGFAAGEYI